MFVVRLNALCMAMALCLAALQAAQPPQSPLIGLSRDDLISRYGEPKSQIVAGNRTVLFFARERVVLRDDVVIEVERLPAEQPQRAPAPAPQPPPADTQPAAPAERPAAGTPATAPSTSANNPPPAAPSRAPAPPPTSPPADTRAAATVTPAETAPPEPKFEIKSVRPPGSAPRPQPRTETPVTQKAESTAPTTATASSPGMSTRTPTDATAPSTTTSGVATNTPPATSASSVAVTSVTPAPETEEPKPEEPPVAEKEKKTKPVKKQVRRRAPSEPDIPETADIISSRRNYVITFLVVAAGVGYIVWRIGQRQLALAATAVSHTPFSTPTAAKAGGIVFNPDLLQKLEWKRFEELVAAYYSKTGVVAVRTKSGPAAPVHIKISWKGEPRPFAYVQCIPHPTGLIDAKPLQDLVTALAAEDIRRGYVVSTGKFGVAARDLAEEKHITLLPGDIFLEKLNALPDSARSEIMQQITTGDYTTPSCPKCEAKMVKAPEDPKMWRCPTHPDQQVPVR